MLSTRIPRNVERISLRERQALAALIQKVNKIQAETVKNAVMDGVREVVAASARTAGKNASERDRRETIGVRVNHEMAARCRHAAQASGRTCYRFVLNALVAECLWVEKKVAAARPLDVGAAAPTAPGEPPFGGG